MSRFLRHQSQDSNVAVLIVVIVAVVSIVTGLAAMVTEPLFRGGEIVGTLQIATGFSAVIVGLLLFAAAWGMRQGYRIAYLGAIFLILLSATQGVAQTRTVSIPLVVLSTVAIVLLIRRRRREYTRSISLTETQVGALLAIGGVIAYGTVGTYALRAEFEGVNSLLDGLYFTLVTASTVGYGDIQATSDAGQVFVITLIILGPASILAVAGTLFGPALESRLTRAGTRATRTGRVRTSDRVLLLGNSDLGERIVDPLTEQALLTVITSDEDWAEELEADGIDVRVDDPTDEVVLERLTDIDPVALVVATDSETTPYAVLAARRVDADVRVVAVTTGGHEADLIEMGADVTIDPESLLARTTVDAALGRKAVSSAA